MFIKIENGLPTTEFISEYEFFGSRKNVSFPSPLMAQDLAPYGYGLYEEANRPEPGLNEKIIEGTLSKDARGVWVRGWVVVPMSPEEIQQAVLIPQIVTMRQARLALLAAGLLDAVEVAIASLPEPTKSAALIDWEFAQEVQRDYGLVPAMATALGMTDAQIDALFVQAASL